MNWQSAVERTVTGLGYDLVDTERSAGGLLRVYIDKLPLETLGTSATHDPSQGFITVEDCEKVTRQLQHVLEVEACAYERLEVSSPGLDRPLKKIADFERFTGERIDLTLKLAFQGRKKYQGVLASLGGESVNRWRIVFNDGKDDQALDFLWEEVREARLVPVVDFKGRRFAPPPQAPANRAAGMEVDGDRKE